MVNQHQTNRMPGDSIANKPCTTKTTPFLENQAASSSGQILEDDDEWWDTNFLFIYLGGGGVTVSCGSIYLYDEV